MKESYIKLSTSKMSLKLDQNDIASYAHHIGVTCTSHVHNDGYHMHIMHVEIDCRDYVHFEYFTSAILYRNVKLNSKKAATQVFQNFPSQSEEDGKQTLFKAHVIPYGYCNVGLHHVCIAYVVK